MDPGTALEYYDSFRNQDAVVATALKSAKDLQETLSSLERIISNKQRYDPEVIAQLSTRIASCKGQAEALKKKVRKIYDNTPRERPIEKLRGLSLRGLYPFGKAPCHATDLVNDGLNNASANIQAVGSDVKAVDGKLTGVTTSVTALASTVANVSQVTNKTQSGVRDLTVDVGRVEKRVESVEEDVKRFRTGK
ncbi:MAG: hypothetical protein M1820_008894 [Bogoriella megaspora]|nr:MAG: hypothetical protein M1820_008894 [Bogoriella megaspora]